MTDRIQLPIRKQRELNQAARLKKEAVEKAAFFKKSGQKDKAAEYEELVKDADKRIALLQKIGHDNANTKEIVKTVTADLTSKLSDALKDTPESLWRTIVHSAIKAVIPKSNRGRKPSKKRTPRKLSKVAA